MSGMSFLEKLLDGVKVEWKTLGEICEVGDGNHSSKYPKGDEMVNHGVPFIRGTNIVNGTISGQDMKYITPEKHRELRKGHLKAYDVLIANRGEIGKVAYIPKHFAGSNLNSQLAWLRSNPAIILPRYLFFVLNTTHIQNSISGEGGALQQLTIKNIKLISIPVPPLEIQAEIVRILDTFTALTAELTAELTDRKKQYNYYRDRLLTFEEGEVEWKTLGDVGKIFRGTAITEKEANPGDYPVVANGPSHNYFHDQSNRSGETIVIARSGVYAGLVSYWDIPIFLTDAFSIHPDNNALSTKFLYYVLKKDQTKIHNMSKGAGVPHVRAKEFESYKVPVLPLEEQARIVAILDKFDTLTTSISEGLPREIALRQKQYEYYRDLLLSFPKAEEDEK